MIIPAEKVKGDCGDLSAGASGILQLALPAKRVEFHIPDIDLYHRTAGYQLPYPGGHALRQQEKHQMDILIID